LVSGGAAARATGRVCVAPAMLGRCLERFYGVKQFKIGNSWIRGVVGGGLTAELVTDFACAYGTYVGGREVVLVRDTRASSPMFGAAVLAGLLSTGCNVANAGVCPTPVAQYLVRRRRAGGGIAVTGSHNAAGWNALKFIDEDGALLNAIRGEEVLDLYHLGEYTKASWDRLGKEEEIAGYVGPYLAETVGKLDVDLIRKARLRVAVDTVNGTAGGVIREFLRFLGCTPILINEEMASDFAHDTAPSVRNMRQLVSLLRHIDVDVGFAVNTDVDRVGIVTEKGEALSEEYTFPLVADHVISSRGASVVTNLSTSMMVERVVERHGGRLVRTKIGEGYVIFRAINEDAILAGEGSGGVAYMPVSRAFDGFLTMALVLEAMARSGHRVSELAARLPTFVMKKGEIPCSPDRVYSVLEEFRGSYLHEQIDLADGVRVAWPDQWVHVRASNTEPILRVIAEGEDPERVERLFADTLFRVNTVVHGKS
jgi:phosphomannomutase